MPGVLEVVNILPILAELEGEFLDSSLGARRRSDDNWTTLQGTTFTLRLNA